MEFDFIHFDKRGNLFIKIPSFLLIAAESESFPRINRDWETLKNKAFNLKKLLPLQNLIFFVTSTDCIHDLQIVRTFYKRF